MWAFQGAVHASSYSLRKPRRATIMAVSAAGQAVCQSCSAFADWAWCGALVATSSSTIDPGGRISCGVVRPVIAPVRSRSGSSTAAR
jgi:hypothetical protein